jgi:hypothetical protein
MSDQNKPEGAVPDDASSRESDLSTPAPAAESGADRGAAPAGSDAASKVRPDAETTSAQGAARPQGTPSSQPTTPTSSKTPKGRAGAPPAGAASTTEAAEQPRYVDDPVTKWWVAIIIAVFAVIFAWALLFGESGLLGGGDEGPTTAPTPSLSTSPSPGAGPAASPSPVTSSAATSPPTIAATPTPTPDAAAPSVAASPGATIPAPSGAPASPAA